MHTLAVLRFVKEVEWLLTSILWQFIGRWVIFTSSSSSVLLRKLNFVFKISSNTLPSVVSITLGCLLACEIDPATWLDSATPTFTHLTLFNASVANHRFVG